MFSLPCPASFCFLHTHLASLNALQALCIFITPPTAPSPQTVGWLLKPNSKHEKCAGLWASWNYHSAVMLSQLGSGEKGPPWSPGGKNSGLSTVTAAARKSLRAPGALFSLENEAALKKKKKTSPFHHGFPNITMANESDHILGVKKKKKKTRNKGCSKICVSISFICLA